MKAFFTRAEDDRLGLRFEPVTFEEQLLLETFTRCVPSDPHVFQFSSWEHNHPRTMCDGLTSCWGQLTRTPKETSPHAEVEVAGQSDGRNSSAHVERETGGALFEDQHAALATHATHALSVAPDSTNGALPWFYWALQAYAVFCRLVPDDASRAALAAAIDASLLAWALGKEPSAPDHMTIEVGVMRGDIDAVIAPALVALFAQIEAGGRAGDQHGPPPVACIDRLDRLQRRILEIWADGYRPHDPGLANMLIAASEGRELTADDLDILEAMAVGEGPRGCALRRALEMREGQAARTSWRSS